MLVSRLLGIDILVLHLGQVELLRAKDGTGARNTNPPNEWLSRDLEMLHGPQADERACATEARLAVDGNSARVLLREMRVCNFHELLDDVIRWRRSIDEKEVIVRDADISEVLLVIFLFVQSDDTLDVEALEDFCVLVGMVTVALVGVSLLDGAHERHKFARDDPVDVAVLDTLKELVLLHVERFEVVPLELDSVLEPLKALQ